MIRLRHLHVIFISSHVREHKTKGKHMSPHMTNIIGAINKKLIEEEMGVLKIVDMGTSYL